MRQIVRLSRNLSLTMMFYKTVIPRCARPVQLPRTAVLATLAVLAGALAAPGAALAASKVVSYHGVHVTVPSNWPVFHLDADSTVCVRFNRHAVYLGRPGAHQVCPVQAAGRTEAILISPQGASPSAGTATVDSLAPVSVLGAGPVDGSMARQVDTTHHVVITATWGNDPAAIRTALGLRSLRSAMLATNGHRPAASRLTRKPKAFAKETSSLTPATPGEVDNGLGFDTCNTPPESTMTAWSTSSPYNAVGVYIGGTNAACPWGNLNQSWVSAESAAGWHLVPIYVGLQAPGNACGCAAMSATESAGQYTTAASQGTAAAQDAVAQAQALGIGAGNPLYFDMENYARKAAVTGPALAFLQAWTLQLHASGYLSGVYASGSSGITDLVDAVGTGYVEPDDLWIADWSTSSSYVPSNAEDPYAPSTDWANNQRLIQYYGGHNLTYGGVKLSVDSDYLDGATAAFGTGAPFASDIAAAPSITVRPQADGSVHLTPGWAGESGISEFQILAGASPTAMTAIQSVSSNRSGAVAVRAVYPYFAVAALNSSGQVVASSTAVTTPASVAIFGNSAFVGASGPVGVPVACLNASPCEVQATIYEGSKRLSHTATETISKHGGVVLFPLSAQVRRLVTTAVGRRLPVTVAVTSSTGQKATRSLNLVPYKASGKAPARKTWASPTLQILAKTNFVSNGWAGGILAVCKASTSCTVTTRVTLAGAALAQPRTQTLGAGEVGYLTFALNNKGHKLLQASKGNQLGARVTVTTAAAPGAVGVISSSSTATALVALDSYR
ncbi:MAG TPA: glycoside hydrolase domain-containing protein [Solirubrobacteraceae bacterium]|nr:glycoside hydrolase domain-containing protein [Solirubrobacteraceae bacterium]